MRKRRHTGRWNAKDSWKFVVGIAAVVVAVVGSVVAMGAGYLALRDDLREDHDKIIGRIDAVRVELREELRGEMHKMGDELRREMQAMREELGGGIKRLESLHMNEQ